MTTLRIRLLLLAGLVEDAARWHLQPRWLATQLGYRLRPYCWQLDRRHPWWQHRRCHCCPPIVITITADTQAFERGIRRASETARMGRS